MLSALVWDDTARVLVAARRRGGRVSGVWPLIAPGHHGYQRACECGKLPALLLNERPRPEAAGDHGPAIPRKQFNVRQLENIYREQNRVEQKYGIQVSR